jgi:hypothetical protein
MVASVASARSPLRAWLGLETSAVATVGVASVLCAVPLLRGGGSGDGLEQALAATGNAFGALVVGEALGIPACAWMGGGRGRPRLAPVALLAALSAAAALQADAGGARVAWYALAGLGAATVHGALVRRAVDACAVRRRACLIATVATVLALLAFGVGAHLLASPPAAWTRAVLLGVAAQGAVLLAEELLVLYPPPPAALPIG